MPGVVNFLTRTERKKILIRVLAGKCSETGGLDYEIHVKLGARVMLRRNINISDRLINGQIMGTIFKVGTNTSTQRPIVLYKTIEYYQ